MVPTVTADFAKALGTAIVLTVATAGPAPPASASVPLPSSGCASMDRLSKGNYTQRSEPQSDWEFSQAPEPTTDGKTVKRTFSVYVPTKHAERDPLPLVIDFHSSLSGAWVYDQTASRMRNKGELEGFIVLQPDSLPAWTTSLESVEQRKLSDVNFVVGLLMKLDRLVCFDRNRIFASGWSAGGGMATVTACASANKKLGDFRVAAIAPVGGFGGVGGDGCPALRDNPVPMRLIISTNDRTLAFGFYGDDVPRLNATIRSSAAAWAAHNGCSGQPTTLSTGQTGWGVLVETITFGCANVSNLRGDTVVDLFDTGSRERNGHIWPGGAHGGAYQTTDEIWKFFKAHPSTDTP